MVRALLHPRNIYCIDFCRIYLIGRTRFCLISLRMAFGVVGLVYNEQLLTKYLQALMLKLCQMFMIELYAVRKVAYNPVRV
jgi:hypothetical protein